MQYWWNFGPAKHPCEARTCLFNQNLYMPRKSKFGGKSAKQYTCVSQGMPDIESQLGFYCVNICPKEYVFTVSLLCP